MSAIRAATPTITQTLTLESTPSSNQEQQIQQPETLVLRLNRKKKKVTWKEGTIDNEFMNKKSSKRCCIFHKEKPFDEDDSDDEDRPNSDKPHGDGCCSHGHGDGRSGNGVADWFCVRDWLIDRSIENLVFTLSL